METTPREQDPVPAWAWLLLGWLVGTAVLERIPRRIDERALRARTPAGFLREERPGLEAASPRELCELPGIGPQRALAIARSRFEEGPIRSAEDLERIPGIGPATVEQVRAYGVGPIRPP